MTRAVSARDSAHAQPVDQHDEVVAAAGVRGRRPRAAMTCAMRASPFSAATVRRARCRDDAQPRLQARRSSRAARPARRATGARARCSAGTPGSARRAARPGSRAGAGACRAGTRRGAARPRSCRCPGPPPTTSTPCMSARIASSCSAWIVATMSPMRPVRLRSSAASSAPSPATGSPLVLDRVLVEHLVVEADDLAALAGDEVAAAHDRHRLDRGGPVEGLGDRRAPVDDERRVAPRPRPRGARRTSGRRVSRSRRPNTSGDSPMSRSASRRWVTSQAMSRSRRAWWVPPARTSA